MHASQLVQLFNNFSLSNQSHTRMIVLFYALLAIQLSSNIPCHSFCGTLEKLENSICRQMLATANILYV